MTDKYLNQSPPAELQSSAEEKDDCEPLRQAWLIKSKWGHGCSNVSLSKSFSIYAVEDLRLNDDCICTDTAEIIYPSLAVIRKVNDLTKCRAALSESQQHDIKTTLDAPIFQNWYWQALARIRKSL